MARQAAKVAKLGQRPLIVVVWQATKNQSPTVSGCLQQNQESATAAQALDKFTYPGA